PQAHHRAGRQAIQLAAYIGFAILGSVVCTICDHLHATHGVLYYTKPDFWSQSWWVPLLFFGASLTVVMGASLIRKLLRGPAVGQPTVGRILGDLVAFVTAYAYTSFGHEKPNVVLAVLVGFWLARVLGSRPRWVIVFSIIVAIGGTAFESFW